MVRGQMTDRQLLRQCIVTTATFLSCIMFDSSCSDDCHATLPTLTIFADMMMMVMTTAVSLFVVVLLSSLILLLLLSLQLQLLLILFASSVAAS